MKIKYFDERLCQDKTEKGLTQAEYNSRIGDLRAMALGGHVSNIRGSQEAIDTDTPTQHNTTPGRGENL